MTIDASGAPDATRRDSLRALLLRCTRAAALGNPGAARAALEAHLSRTPHAPATVEQRRAWALLARLNAAAGYCVEAERALSHARGSCPHAHRELHWIRARLEIDWIRGDARALTAQVRALLAEGREASHQVNPGGNQRGGQQLDDGVEPGAEYRECLHLGGLALAVLGRPDLARGCLARLEALAASGDGALAAEIRAELAWQVVLARWSATVASHRSPRPDSRVQGKVTVAARESYERCLTALADGAACDPLHLARVSAGRDKCLLLERDDPSALVRLERHFARVQALPLVHECAMVRVALACAHLAQQRFASAARLFGRPEAVDERARVPEAILAAFAFERIGDHAAALAWLKLRLRAELEEEGDREPRRAHSAEELARAAVELACTRPEATPNVACLARLLGVSRRTLENAFRQAALTTPKRALISARLNEARRRVSGSGQDRAESLECIARRSGFPSYQAFARAVRGTFDLAPSAWRASV